MSVLRPDPAEYIEDFGCGEIRPIDYLSAALIMADSANLTVADLWEIAGISDSTREFERGVREAIRDRAA